jgi:hypothetical protein
LPHTDQQAPHSSAACAWPYPAAASCRRNTAAATKIISALPDSMYPICVGCCWCV